MRKLGLVVVVLAVMVVGVPAGAQVPVEYFVDPETLPFEALPGIETERYWGIDENAGAAGDGWRVEVPADWNGGLVLWAHGYRGVGAELTVDDPALRAYLVATGWAWAASSYRANGYAVEEGVEDTHELLGIFAEQTGRTPDRVIFHGASMGGHITGAAIERYPDAYDGALPICGAMGDQALYDYFQDVNLVAQALAGVEASIPPGPDYLTTTLAAISEELGYPGELTGRGFQFSAATEQLSGGERPGFDGALEYWSGPETSNVGAPFLFEVYSGVLSGGRTDPRADASTGNEGRVYQYDTEPPLSPEEEELNAAMTRDEAAGASPFPIITGDLPIPVLSLHTIGDLFVPFSMEQVYAAEAATTGSADLLVTRAIRDVRHCGFAPQELVAAFDDLIAWLDTGERPAGDDVGDPETVADRDFGCAFTAAFPDPGRAPYRPCGAPPSFALTTGADRVATAVEASRASRDSADAVVLADAYDFEAALAGAPLAGREDAPLLLTPPGGLRADVAAEIERLGATTVYLVGEELSVEGDFDVVRLAGPADVARELGGTGAFAVAGTDGAAVAGLAAFLEEPILFVGRFAVPPETAQLIAELSIDRVTVVGAVSGRVIQQLSDLGVEVDRLADPVALAERSIASGVSPRAPWLALGWPDAVVGGPAAAETGDLLLAIRPATIRYLLDERRVLERLRVVGGQDGLHDVGEALAEGAGD